MDWAVAFSVEGMRFALPLAVVERVLRAVEVTPLPGAPGVVSGVLHVHGEVVAVVDLRRRCGLPGREMELDDHILIARTSKRRLAIPVDGVSGVVSWRSTDFVAAATLAPGLGHLQGVARLGDGLVLVQDLEAFLSLQEEGGLDEALAQAG